MFNTMKETARYQNEADNGHLSSGGPGVGKIQKALILLACEMLGQPVLVFADRPQLALDALAILESAALQNKVVSGYSKTIYTSVFRDRQSKDRTSKTRLNQRCFKDTNIKGRR